MYYYSALKSNAFSYSKDSQELSLQNFHKSMLENHFEKFPPMWHLKKKAAKGRGKIFVQEFVKEDTFHKDLMIDSN